jgi:hypothetical protein
VTTLTLGEYNYASYGTDSDVAYYNLTGGTLNVSSNFILGRISEARGHLKLGNATGATGEVTGAGNMLIKNGAHASGIGIVQGFGNINLTGALTNNGKVIADGWGGANTSDRTLAMKNFSSIATVEASQMTGAGWYAQNRGKLVLPDVNVTGGSSTVYFGEDAAGSQKLVNSIKMDFTNVNGGVLKVSLLSADNSESSGTGNIIGLWDINAGNFDFGNGSVNLTIKYDAARLAELGLNEANLKLFQKVDCSWVDVTASVDTVNKLICANGITSFLQFAVGTDITYVPVYAKKPVFSSEGGYYIVENETVTITCETPGAEIRYTLDGTEPTQSSLLCEGSVSVEPGQTLSARAFATGFEPSEIKTVTFKAFYPRFIPRADGSVSIDGDLSEWQASEFVSLDKNYTGGSPITEASYAVRWNGTTNQFYVAVKVNDPVHVFEDIYAHWNTQDGVEIYVHTTGGDPLNYESTQSSAQQYVIGLKTPASRTSVPTADVWKTFAGDYEISDALAGQIGLQTACVEEVDGLGNPTGWLFYEVAMTAYDYLDKDTPANSIVSPLMTGAQVGVDAIICDKYASGFGMKSENILTNKHKDWSHIGLHKLAMHPADFNADGKFSSEDIDLLFVQVKNGLNDPAYDLTGDDLVNQSDMDVMVLTLLQSQYGDANCDSKVDVGDLGILAANYGGSDKRWNLGDFNGDGKVDVGDLGILAANYGAGSASGASFEADYAKVFGTAAADEETDENSSLCSGLGLPMIAGLVLMGLMLVKLEE